jgi:DNA-binding transcriptional LysR family regulator
MLHALTLRQIEAFQAVMASGSLTGAARMLNLTQPAISRLIQSMEAVLALELFERSGNRVAPTPEAGLLYEEVERCFIGLDRIEQAAFDIGRSRVGAVRVASMTGPSLAFLPAAIARFKRDFDKVAVAVTTTDSKTVRDLVAMRHCHIGLAYAEPGHPGLEVEAVDGIDMVCAMAQSHRLAKKQTVSLADLDGEALIAMGSGSEIWHRFAARMQEAGAALNIAAEVSVSYAACELARRGLGIAVVEPFSAACFGGLALRPLRPALPFNLSMVFAQGVLRPKAVEAFADVIRARAALPDFGIAGATP